MPDADRQLTEFVNGLRHETPHKVYIGDIAGRRDAGRARLGGDGFGRGSGALGQDIVQKRRRAFRAELARDLITDAFAGAGDDDRLIRKSLLCHN